MKKRILNIILGIIFLAGLSLLLYPTFSEYWNSFQQSRAITGYSKEIKVLDAEKYEEILKSAREYNSKLFADASGYMMSEEQKVEYEQELNLSNNGIMGYIEIPKIKCSLPIYHGTDEAVLQIAIGHLEWTSLPIGGESTHSVLSGHRGLPSAKLFTDLDKMEEGDRFFIRVLNEVLTYEVDQIKVVLPEEIEDLEIVEGEDYCTLFTCTPYAVNTHRLLVRGHRVDNVSEGGDGAENQILNPEMLERQRLEENLKKAVSAAAVIVAVMAGLLVIMKVSKGKKKSGGDVNENK